MCVEHRENVLHSRLWEQHTVSVSYILIVKIKEVFLSHMLKRRMEVRQDR
jgi:hypothetical protein